MQIKDSQAIYCFPAQGFTFFVYVISKTYGREKGLTFFNEYFLGWLLFINYNIHPCGDKKPRQFPN